MVRKGCEKPGEEVQKDRTARRAGKGHHITECQHEMLNHTQVKLMLNDLPHAMQQANDQANASAYGNEYDCFIQHVS